MPVPTHTPPTSPTTSPTSSPDKSLTPAPDAAVPKLACFRKSPRPCVNQKLVDELAPLRMWRFLQYGTQAKESISYATAISVIIGTPFLIKTKSQARLLPKVGDKIITKIDEFLQDGSIQETRDVLNSEKYQTLQLLTTIHGVGYNAANSYYDEGIRTVEELVKSKPGFAKQLKYLPDLNEKISRADVESIHAFVRLQLGKVKPGAQTVLCGGYRRGKEFSNDVDILITWPHQEGAERGVLKLLLDRLLQKGLLPSDGLFGYSFAGSDRTIAANRPAPLVDTLDKALIVFRHPANATSRTKDTFRRVDLIVTGWSNFGVALLGWTGSTQFERDLRTHAKAKNIKLDSGGLRTQDTDEPIAVGSSEEDVFRVLGLEYIDPTLRNADP
ncbi:hypothetical protein JCM10207_003518 [Rhodosporidiobolus poonsookiae]